MRQRIEALERRVADLEVENAALRSENASLRSENTALRKALEDERRAGKRQASPFSRGIRNPDPKKPGRRPGGSRSRRSIPAQIDRKVVVPPLLMCPQCAGAVRLGTVVRQYQVDLPPIRPTTTEFEIHRGVCTRCGRMVQGRDPEQISSATGEVGGVQIGPQVIALAAHLNKVCGVSYERIAEIFGQVFGLDLERSTIARALLRLGRKSEATYRQLIEAIRGSPVVYPDETGWRVGGEKAWLWAVTTLTATVYLIERGRGFPEASKTPGRGVCGSHRSGRLGTVSTLHEGSATDVSGASAAPVSRASRGPAQRRLRRICGRDQVRAAAGTRLTRSACGRADLGSWIPEPPRPA